ncbi:MAG: beta strand repeat-containing protein [Opitutaceae bacterium]
MIKLTTPLLLTTAAAFVLSGAVANAATDTWDGDTDALWSDTTNWVGATIVPGTGDTATFNSVVGTGGAAVIDLSGGVTIGALEFTGASVAAYTIGAGAVGTDTLTLDNGGNIVMTSTVANDQLINAHVVLGTDATSASNTLTNNSANTLTIAGDISGGTGGSAVAKTFTIFGTGTTHLSGVISDGGATSLALTKSTNPGGTLILSGANTYSGGTNINAGNIVQANNDNALGTGTVTLANSNAVLELGDGVNISNTLTVSDSGANKIIRVAAGATSAEYSGNINKEESGAGNTDLVATSGQTLTLSGVLSSTNNTGDFNLTGNGTVVLSGDNTFGNAIRITTGGATLRLEHDNAAGVSGVATAIEMRQSGTIELADGVNISRGIVTTTAGGNKTLVLETGATAAEWSGQISNAETNPFRLSSDGSSVLTVSGNLIGAQSYTKIGTGVVVLSGTNTYAGATTTISNGTLVIANKAARSSSTTISASAAGTAGLGVGAGGVTDYSETDVADLFNTNTLTGFTLDAASGVALDTTAGDFTQSTALTAARDLTKLGVNTLTLSGSNSYSGATNVNAGTLSLTGSLTGGGAIEVGSSGTLSQSAAGVISGASAISNSGITTLAGDNTYTGTTTLSEGTLNINSTTALGTGTFVIGNGTTIDNTSGGAITLANDNLITVAGNVNGNYFTFGGTNDLNLGEGAIDFQLPATAGVSTGIIQLNGSGSTLTFGGASVSTARGTGVTTIEVNGAGNTLVFGSLGLNERGATSTNIWSGSADVTVNGGVLDTAGGAKNFAYAGSGTFTMGGAGTYTGSTTVSSGTLQLLNSLAIQNSALNTAGSTLGDASNGLKTTVTALTFGGLTGDKDLASVFTTTSGGYDAVTALTLNNAGNSSYSGVIGNGASGMDLIKTGAGTQTLTGTSTYTGTTGIIAGTLIVDGSIASSSLVTVDSGATLGGSGNLGAVVIDGTLAIGNSPGTMTFSSLTLAGTAIYEIDGTAGAGVTGGHDFADVTGALTYGGDLDLDIGTIFAAGNYTFDLFDFGSQSGDLASIVLSDQYSGSLLDGDLDGIWDLNAGNDTWQFTQSTGVLTLSVVPEPGSYALLAGLLGLGYVMVRRRRQS